ncbi:MAG: DDE-type integrase/transposase/recombinase [Coriobacteriia bacterium]|nr:DDE-type integrase/transposase/recombinase [Coriobacteriia bacterium]
MGSRLYLCQHLGSYCYVAFIVDVYARRIVGHAVSTRMNKDMVARAFSVALWSRTKQNLGDFENLIHHTDQSSQYISDDFIELLARHEIKTSIGSVGCSYDNALAETINGAYKNELINFFGPWKSFEELNLETEIWVKWYNEERINEYCDWQTPSEVEQLWYATGEDFRKEVKS